MNGDVALGCSYVECRNKFEDGMEPIDRGLILKDEVLLGLLWNMAEEENLLKDPENAVGGGSSGGNCVGFKLVLMVKSTQRHDLRRSNMKAKEVRCPLTAKIATLISTKSDTGMDLLEN
ncbi:hypothetical protein HPP92_006580 [Vanilla planifolia]|uniref:Uncharacterized protein n=1 Tax=Vanilla planifolia TaxID=51239 RepID=A0A835RW81_VANPL|nr:hypothetical protein HPP92_006580 [Vanilla planifolia]